MSPGARTPVSSTCTEVTLAGVVTGGAPSGAAGPAHAIHPGTPRPLRHPSARAPTPSRAASAPPQHSSSDRVRNVRTSAGGLWMTAAPVPRAGAKFGDDFRRSPTRTDAAGRAPVPRRPLGRRGPTRGEARGPRGDRRAAASTSRRSGRHRPEQRVGEQAVRLPRGGAVTGWAACMLQGATYFDGLAPTARTRLPVPLALGHRGNIRGDPGATLLRDVLAGR